MLYKYEDGKLNVFEMKIDCYELRNVRERILENCSIVMKCEGVFLEFYYNYFKKLSIYSNEVINFLQY